MDNDTYSEPVVDRHGNVMFYCGYCGSPIGRDDILDLGMRLPDFGETAQDYQDSELVDSFRHKACVSATRAS